MRLFCSTLLFLFLSIRQSAQTYTVYTPTVSGANTNYVQVITKAFFANDAHTMAHSYLVDFSNNTIHVSSCYFYPGILTVLTTLTNTVNVGILPQGNYNLSYTAYISGDGTNCTPFDTIIFPPAPFYVGPNSMKEFEIEQNIQIAPNPVNDNFKLICADPNFGVMNILIFNSLGQKVHEIIKPNLNSEMGLDLDPGVYFLELNTETKVKRIKFLKE